MNARFSVHVFNYTTSQEPVYQTVLKSFHCINSFTRYLAGESCLWCCLFQIFGEAHRCVRNAIGMLRMKYALNEHAGEVSMVLPVFFSFLFLCSIEEKASRFWLFSGLFCFVFLRLDSKSQYLVCDSSIVTLKPYASWDILFSRSFWFIRTLKWHLVQYI